MRLRASEDQPLAGHAVTSELLRVRGYYQKIDAAEKKAEGKEDQPAVRLNREAAARVIKHGIVSVLRKMQTGLLRFPPNTTTV